MSITEKIENLYARSALAQLVAKLLQDPKTRTVACREEGLDETFGQALACAERAGLAEAVPLVEGLCRSINPVELDDDYRRTFGHIPAGHFSPYETSYGWENAFAQSQHLADIGGFYAAFGVETARLDRERHDHLGAETEFLSFLLFKEALALEDGNEDAAEVCRNARRRFLEEHLGRWGAVVFERLEREAPNNVYQLCGRLGRQVLLSELHLAGARCAALQRTEPPREGIIEDFCPELLSCPGNQSGEEL